MNQNHKIPPPSFIILALMLMFAGIYQTAAQVDEVKIKAAYIHQLTQNITWQNPDYIDIYHFGIITNDKDLVKKMNEIADNYELNNKPIAVEKTQIDESFLGYQMLFVDEGYCEQLPTISDKIKDKNILIISFECQERLFIMINLFREPESNTISYEINVENLENAGFKYTPELLMHGGTLVDLKELYKRTTDQLNTYNTRLAHLESELSMIEKERARYQKQVDSLNRNINVLHNEIKNKALEYNQLINEINVKDTQLALSTLKIKSQAQKSETLRNELEKQLADISKSQTKLNRLNNEYHEKQEHIINLQDSINKKQQVINYQTDKISSQKKLLLLSIALGLALIIALIAIFYSFMLKKQMAKKLQELVNQRTRELMISKQYFQSLIENSPVVLIELDISGLERFIGQMDPATGKNALINDDASNKLLEHLKVIDFNKLTYSYLETNNKSDIQNNFVNIFPKRNNKFLAKGLLSLLNREQTFESEAEIITFKGKVRNTLVNWVVLNDDKGIKNRLLLSALDITTQKRYEKELQAHRDNLEELVEERTIELKKQKLELEKALEQLKQAQKQLVNAEKMASLGLLTAGVAHEINNPVNFISGGYQGITTYTDLLKNYHQNILDFEKSLSANPKSELREINAKIEEYEVFKSMDTLLKSIEDGVERTTKIVNSLNSYSYDSKENIENYQITEAIENALVILENKIKHRIKLTRNIKDAPFIKCNPGKISQVFLNIVSNAVDAIQGKGEIHITVEEKKEHAVVMIKDTGTGMDKETIKHAFDPFYTTKTVGKGTGLGLYITYGIVQQHGGNIFIDSEKNKGTTITIALPVNKKN